MLTLCLLGPVQVLSTNGPVDAGPARQRCVLAALGVELGRPVPIPALIDRVWDERPPQRDRCGGTFTAGPSRRETAGTFSPSIGRG